MAGKGVMTDKHKGGSMVIRCDEQCYIMGIVSITPRIDYSQGNDWDMNNFTMADWHIPGMDRIGFQDLITDTMAWFDTAIRPPYDFATAPRFKSAGKMTAWINYQTAVNKVFGDFAIENAEMFMVLLRRYEAEATAINTPLGSVRYRIGDLTTYIDPSKFNFIFADTKLNAMNFRVQILSKVFARRKMSAKTMPAFN